MTKTECGIFGIISNSPLTNHRLISGLKSLQHRGRDSFGFSYYDEGIEIVKSQGLVHHKQVLKMSNVWMGHVRYSTSTKMMKYCQPIYSTDKKFSIFHNGNIKESIWENFNFIHDKYDSDTYKLMLLIQDRIIEGYSFEESLKYIIDNIEGSFCIVIHTKNNLYILRDRFGIKPLSYLTNDDIIIITSEAENKNYQNFDPGSLYSLNIENLNLSKIYQREEKKKRCSFELVYFMKQNTYFDEESVLEWRQRIAGKLWEQSKKLFHNFKREETFVCGVPSSGIVYGEEFAKLSNLPYEQFLKKKKDYPFRTFILDSNSKRLGACQKKYFIDSNIENKKIIILDDSVVRGNTMKFLVAYLKKFQPKEIHLISGSPLIISPCHYGVDFPDIEELIATKMNLEEMRRYFKLDSLTFLNVENLTPDDSYCNGCFTGKYMF